MPPGAIDPANCRQKLAYQSKDVRSIQSGGICIQGAPSHLKKGNYTA